MVASLFTLPIELRQQIWDLVIERRVLEVLHHDWRPPRVLSRAWRFMLTSKDFYNDTIHLYRQCDTIECEWGRLPPAPITPHLVDQIRVLKFHSPCDASDKYYDDNCMLIRCILEFKKLHTVQLPFRNKPTTIDTTDSRDLRRSVPGSGWPSIENLMIVYLPDVHLKCSLLVRNNEELDSVEVRENDHQHAASAQQH